MRPQHLVKWERSFELTSIQTKNHSILWKHHSECYSDHLIVKAGSELWEAYPTKELSRSIFAFQD